MKKKLPVGDDKVNRISTIHIRWNFNKYIGINNSDIFDTFKDLYLSEKEREEKLLQVIQSANGLKVWPSAKKTDGLEITVKIKKMQSKRLFVKGS